MNKKFINYFLETFYKLEIKNKNKKFSGYFRALNVFLNSKAFIEFYNLRLS